MTLLNPHPLPNAYAPKSTVTRREALAAMNRLIENLSGIRVAISTPAP